MTDTPTAPGARPSRTKRRLLLIGTALAAVSAGAGFAWRALRAPDLSAEVAALFQQTFDDANGVAQPMAQWRGRWLVVNFWATWCAPCVDEMPGLQRIARDFADRNVAVVGLGIDRADAIRRFQSELKLEIPLLVAGASGTDVARALGNPMGALPYTVLISPDGRVVNTRLGLIKPETLRDWLESAS
jgi:peroxiredoxin